MVALLRPDSWDFPLFLHVLGAAVLVGAIAAALIAGGSAGQSALLRRVAFRTLAVFALPAWILMRVTGQWVEAKEDIEGDPAWLGIGYIVGDAGLLILLIATGVAWWSAKRPDRRWPQRTVTVLAALYLAALLLSVWAMTAKPE